MNPIVSLRDIVKTYQTGDVAVKAVAGVSLNIDPGEFVAFMGSSGSGKSTLMNILGCLDRPTRGEYLLDGINVSSLDRNELADIRNHKIGFVFQNFNLLARTSALENVELPLLYGDRHFDSAAIHEKGVAALEAVGLGSRLDHHPAQLSGGQQQRVAVARALINEPGIILADEPTGNLDSRTTGEIMSLFQSLNERGITIIMVTHEPDVAAWCKRSVVMRDGEVVSDRPVKNRTTADREMAKLAAD